MANGFSTYVGCLCVHHAELLPVAAAALERFHVAFICRQQDADVWYEVTAITAQQYDAVIEALSDSGEPGIDWDFALE
jgi:hypothetical protein